MIFTLVKTVQQGDKYNFKNLKDQLKWIMDICNVSESSAAIQSSYKHPYWEQILIRVGSVFPTILSCHYI